MATNVCWGIEVGAGAVKAVKLEADEGRVSVADFAVIPHPKVLSTPDLDVDDAVRVALGALVSQRDLSGATLAVSVPGHQSFARFAKLPPVEKKKVPDIVKFEAVQQIPFPITDVEWDYQTFVSPDSPEVEVGIFAVTRAKIMEKLAQLNDVGLTPELATLSPVAVYNALAYDLEFTEKTPGTIIMDVGTTATDLIFADQGRVWVATFPVGGHAFTDALVGSFKLSYSKAEKLKREAEQTKHARHVFQAMRPVFTDLVQEVQRRMGFYQNSHPGAEIKRLIGVGSTFQLPGLRKYLKQQLGIEVYRLEEFKRLTVEGPRKSEFDAAAGGLATAVGLALQGLGRGTLNANVMPVAVLRDSMWKRKRVWFGAAAGVAAATGAVMLLRPLLDSSAVASATRAESVARAVSLAGQLSGEANSQGLTEGAEGDLTAAKIVALATTPEVMANLSRDLGLLTAAAVEAAAGQSVPAEVAATPLTLVRLATAYEVPAAAGEGDPFAEPTYAEEPTYGAEGEEQPSGEGGEGGAGTDGPETEQIDITKRRRVMVTAEFRTGHPDARRFARETLAAWLRANATREGVPYTVYVPEDGVEVVLAGQTAPNAGFGGAAPAGSRVTFGGARGGGPAAPPGFGREEERGGGRFAGGPPGAPPGGGFAAPPAWGGAAAPASGGAEPEVSETELLQKLESLAPVAAPPVGPAGATVVLRWALLLPEPVAATGGEENQG